MYIARYQNASLARNTLPAVDTVRTAGDTAESAALIAVNELTAAETEVLPAAIGVSSTVRGHSLIMSSSRGVGGGSPKHNAT